MVNHPAGVRIRPAEESDVAAMACVEQAAQRLLLEQGVDLGALDVPEDLDEGTSWTFALVAELDRRVVGIARLTELTSRLVALDQLSVEPAFSRQGIGRALLVGAADVARESGYAAITGTTFRHILFNAPFYADLGAEEDPDPHPVMLERRRVETEIGLDAFGPRLVMRARL